MIQTDNTLFFMLAALAACAIFIVHAVWRLKEKQKKIADHHEKLSEAISEARKKD